MTIKHWLAAGILAASAGTATAGERAAATVDCAPTDEHLIYTCMIMLKGRKSGAPVVADQVIVKADMPTMPMAHNVSPAAAMPVDGEPGHYMTTFELEMFGEWALAIEVEGTAGDDKVRDKVIVKREFGQAHAGTKGHDEGHGTHGSGHVDKTQTE